MRCWSRHWKDYRSGVGLIHSCGVHAGQEIKIEDMKSNASGIFRNFIVFLNLITVMFSCGNQSLHVMHHSEFPETLGGLGHRILYFLSFAFYGGGLAQYAAVREPSLSPVVKHPWGTTEK